MFYHSCKSELIILVESVIIIKLKMIEKNLKSKYRLNYITESFGVDFLETTTVRI